MKVLMFGWEFPPHNSGGLGVACRGLASALTQSGVEVDFVLPKRVTLGQTPCNMLFADDARGRSVKIRSVDVLLMPYVTSETYSEWRKNLPPDQASYAQNLYEEVHRYGALARAVARDSACDVIHAHDWLSFRAGIEAKRVSGRPLVVHVHATEFDRSGENINQAVYEIEQEGVTKADQVVAVSNFTKERLITRYGVDLAKIEVVHNGINEAEYREVLQAPLPDSISTLKQQGYKIVLFVGRITFQKGPDYFVKMARRVLEHCPDTYFVVSGSGDMENQMMREVADSQLSDKFIFAGFLRGRDLSMVYRSADIYIMPSVSEPFGITPLESMMHDTPTLISNQSGVSEVVAHALKVDFWDVDEMAGKVIAVLKYPSLYKTLCENGRREVQKVNWLSAGEKLIGVYGRLLAGRTV